LTEEEESLRRLEALDNDYDVLLEQLEKDPNFVKRIAPATLGTGPEDGNAIYPRATAEELAAAREVLGSSDKQAKEVEIPGWILRCSKEPHQILLFLAGAFLILISFIFFGPARHQPEGEE
jgi:type II secretory pathway component GspD/PulD (secretin)